MSHNKLAYFIERSSNLELENVGLESQLELVTLQLDNYKKLKFELEKVVQETGPEYRGLTLIDAVRKMSRDIRGTELSSLFTEDIDGHRAFVVTFPGYFVVGIGETTERYNIALNTAMDEGSIVDLSLPADVRIDVHTYPGDCALFQPEYLFTMRTEKTCVRRLSFEQGRWRYLGDQP